MRINRFVILIFIILAKISFTYDISNNKFKLNEKMENGIKSHRHSIGVDFSPMIFYTLLAPTIVNSTISQSTNLQGIFGLNINYTYRLQEKIDINADIGLYTMKTFYNNDKSKYNGAVYGIGFVIGGRFYFNKKDRASGFFLMPKFGTTLYITHNNEYNKQTQKHINKNTYIWDIYISSEMGFRIDISRGLGIDTGYRPFLDISILDVGLSYKTILRFVPLPRLSIGILF